MVIRGRSTCSSGASRGQKFLDREVRELHNSRITSFDNGNQTGTCDQKCLFLVLPTPIQVQLRDPFHIVEVNCEDLRKLRNAKRPNGHNEALQYTSSVAPIRPLDFLQYTLIRLVQGFR